MLFRCQIMDRSYARKFGGIISLAIFYQYHEEQDMRLKGEVSTDRFKVYICM